jgi:hypothetical protein
MPLDILRQIVARWPDPAPAHVPLLKQAGIEAVVLDSPNESFQRACADAGIDVAPASTLQTAFEEGLWPGVRGGPNTTGSDDQTASASREPWIDANGYLIAVHRALHPKRPSILSYQPNDQAGLSKDRMVPFQSLEIALAEARVGGGNYILSLEARYRSALLANDPKALAAWKQLGATATWCRENGKLFGRPALPAITMLVEEGESAAELANIAYRRNCSALAPAVNPPAPIPAHPGPLRRFDQTAPAIRLRPNSGSCASR